MGGGSTPVIIGIAARQNPQKITDDILVGLPILPLGIDAQTGSAIGIEVK
jgi:hypothetical protein